MAVTIKKDSTRPKGNSPATVAFDYIKGQSFRSIHADGVIGSVTPNGNIHMAFFAERMAIPRRIVNALNPDGSLGEAVADQTETRGSIVREMDVDVFMTVETAKQVIEWLRERIDERDSKALTHGELQ